MAYPSVGAQLRRLRKGDALQRKDWVSLQNKEPGDWVQEEDPEDCLGCGSSFLFTGWDPAMAMGVASPPLAS